MKINTTHTAIAVTMLGLGACDRVSTPDTREAAREARTQETAGQKLDHAVESTQQTLAQVGDKIGPKLAEVTEKTKEQLAVAGEKTHQALAGASEKTGHALSEAGDKVATSTDHAVNGGKGSHDAKGAMSDTAITASVKAGFLKDPDLSVLKIDVDTNDGVVTLNGLAGNEDARVRAAKMAEATKGVREVRNYLVTKRG